MANVVEKRKEQLSFIDLSRHLGENLQEEREYKPIFSPWSEIALFIPLQSDTREIYDYYTRGSELFNGLSTLEDGAR